MNERSNKFMTSWTWRTKRKQVLERDGHQCQICNKPARIVHHIFPLDEFPEYGMNDWNLVSLCCSCHNRIDSARSELSDAGKKMLRDTALKQGVPIPEKYK